jgi:quinoprotein glucose dehydrogenase
MAPLVAALILLTQSDTPLRVPDLRLDRRPAPAAPSPAAAPAKPSVPPKPEIIPGSVERLQVAWRWKHGETWEGKNEGRRPSFSATPVHAEGKLFIITPRGTAVALDASSGRELWRVTRVGETRRSWGAAYAAGRLFFGTPDGKLLALAAGDGSKIWEVDLRAGLAPGHLSQNMPPTLIAGLVITGGELPEGTPRGPAGSIRAWRQSDGKLIWTFHTVPQDDDAAAKTWAPGSRVNRTGVNVWGRCAADEAARVVFCPTGSASYDFYGGDRKGANLYANSVLALDARTGRLLWHKQLVHHDIWDYDLPAQPVLLDVKQDGRIVPALAQVTKMGFVWFLHRRTGEAIFGEEEKPAPQSRVPGEETWPTQPWPIAPAPLSRTRFEESDLNTLTPEWAQECRALFDQVGNSGIFEPWGTTKYTLMLPGTLGGGTWSGAAYDAARRLLFVNANELGIVGKMVERNGSWARVSPQAHARFATKDYVPCTLPPWNTLNAIDVDSGAVRWRVPLGELPQAAEKGIRGTGAYGLGGSLATEGGIVFIGGAADSRFRAFDAQTGRQLWEFALPASAYATPLRYGDSQGRETIVVAAGGGSFFPGPLSDELIAFRIR